MGIGRNAFPGKQPPPREELIHIWETSKDLALEFADYMPADRYLFQPGDLTEVYTYGGQMQHIAENNNNLLGDLWDEPTPDISLESEDDKQTIMRNIRRSFDYGTAILEHFSNQQMMEVIDEFFAGPLPRWHIIFVAQDHTTHHCGQAVVYLRLNGIEPPYYHKW